MTRSLVSSVVLACSLMLGLEFAAWGQTAAGVYAPPFNQTMTKQTQRVLDFYGRSNSAAVSLNQIPRRPTSPPAVPWSPRPTKPFTGGSLRSSVSPYLNLFRWDSEDSAPNYFAFVQPQLQQQEFAQRQQAEMRRLNRQVQAASASLGIAPAGSGAVPSTGHATRYMNTGGYYRFMR